MSTENEKGTEIPETEVKSTEANVVEAVKEPNEQEVDKPENSVESKDQETEPKESEEEKLDSEPVKKKVDKHSWQGRVNSLTKRLREAEGKIAQLQTPTPTLTKPVRSSFTDEESYIDALTDFKISQKLPQLQEKINSGSVEQKFSQVEDQVRSEIEDYDDIVAEPIVLPQMAIDAIVSSDIGPRIRYYLGTHPDEAEALNKLPPVSAAKQIGKLEVKLESELAAKKSQPVNQVSQARPPIKPVKTVGSTAKIDENKLSDAEWFKLEQKRAKEKLKI